jgi:hypothetical protein
MALSLAVSCVFSVVRVVVKAATCETLAKHLLAAGGLNCGVWRPRIASLYSLFIWHRSPSITDGVLHLRCNDAAGVHACAFAGKVSQRKFGSSGKSSILDPLLTQCVHIHSHAPGPSCTSVGMW